MPFRRRRSMPSKRKVKHSGTLIADVGAGSNATSLIILKTSGGPRSTDGSPQTIQSFSSTDEDCKTGDQCKFVNLALYAGPKDSAAIQDRIGWMEWAFICVRENETAVPATRLGVQTLGDICTNMYRGECIMTGAIPVGGEQPSLATIKLKIPKSKVSIKLGDEWRFITNFRAVNAVSTSVNAIRSLKSFNYKI